MEILTWGQSLELTLPLTPRILSLNHRSFSRMQNWMHYNVLLIVFRAFSREWFWVKRVVAQKTDFCFKGKGSWITYEKCPLRSFRWSRKTPVTPKPPRHTKNTKWYDIANKFETSLLRKAFNRSLVRTGFGAGLISPLNPQNCGITQKILENGHFYFLRQALVCTTRSDFIRDI